jgi:hypothetical protein
MYCFMPFSRRMAVCDTGCQSGSWAYTHLLFFFYLWKFIIDQFHHFSHKCRQVTQASEFRAMRGINDSYVEQLHAVQRALGLTIQSTAKPKAMLLLQLLQHDTFVKKADKAGVPKEKRLWPDAASVPTASPLSLGDFDAELQFPGYDAAMDDGEVPATEGAMDEDEAPAAEGAPEGAAEGAAEGAGGMDGDGAHFAAGTEDIGDGNTDAGGDGAGANSREKEIDEDFSGEGGEGESDEGEDDDLVEVPLPDDNGE